MTTDRELDALIASFDEAVNNGLAYLAGSGAESGVKIESWTAREVLAHMVFWHQATVEGMEAVGSNGDPYQIDASTDEVNAEHVAALADTSTADIADRIRELQTRLVAAVRSLDDPSAIVFIRSSGVGSSALQRLEMMANHWNGHIRELQAQ